MIYGPYGAQYLLEALYGAGEGVYALSLFGSTALRSWYNMFFYKDANGTSRPQTMTQEAWDKTLKTNEDWNHVWGAAAGNIIPRWLMGVRPLAPGFQKTLIQPQPGTLAYASLTMPTVRGPISVSVQANTATDSTLSVNVPANTTAEVHRRGRLAHAGEHQHDGPDEWGFRQRHDQRSDDFHRQRAARCIFV